MLPGIPLGPNAINIKILIVAIRGGVSDGLVRDWRYTKLSLVYALLLLFLACALSCCSLLFISCFVLFSFSCSRRSFVDAHLIFSCPPDHVPDWQPRVLLGMVEARSVHVKNIHTHTHTHTQLYVARALSILYIYNRSRGTHITLDD